MTGVQVTAGASANQWGADVEVKSAASSTKPFRIVGYAIDPKVSQWYKIRFSKDNGATYFDEVMVSGSRTQEGSVAPSGTEFIFNTGTRIVASAKAESGGGDTANIWLKIQTI